MITFTNTVDINRPVAEVYEYLSDLENTPGWNWAITETTKVTPGPVAVGTRYRQTRSAPQPATETLDITRLVPNRAIDIQGTLAQFAARLSYVLDGHEDRTKLANTVHLETTGPLQIVAPLLGKRIKRAVADNLNDLKTLLETDHSPLLHNGAQS